MAVKTMATIAIWMEVTTWPWPALLNTPYAGIGAVGWITMMPYRMRSQSVSARRKRGADETVVPEIESMSRLLESVEPKTVNPRTRFDAPPGTPGDLQSS